MSTTKYNQQVLVELYQLLLDTDKDLTIYCEDGPMKCHKFILAASSEYFKASFYFC